MDDLLLETGDRVLLETGDALLLETSGSGGVVFYIFEGAVFS
jgi:hypothetical protein